MIVESGNRIIFDGNGIATDFPYSFIIINSTDIQVAISDDETGEVTVLTKDYFVDTAASKVVYPGYSPGQEPADEAIPEVLPVGKKLIVYRSVPLTQESDLGSKYPFDTIEKGLDKNCILIQQIADAQNRSLTLPVNTPLGFAAELPTPKPRTSFRVNDTGTGYEVTKDPATVLPLAENIKAEVEAIKKETEEFKDQAETAATTAATEAAATAAASAVSDVQDILDNIVEEVNTAKTTAVASASTATAKASEATTAATSATTAANTASTASNNASNYASQAQTASSTAVTAGNTATAKASEASSAATSATNAATTATSVQTTVSGYLSSIESSVAEVNAAKTSALGAAASADSSASTATTAADIASSSKAAAAQSAAEAAQSAADAAAAAGGDFIPSAQKGGINGVATLDGSALLSSTQIPLIPASKIIGTIKLDNLPQGALERLVHVANITAMYSLTMAQVQNGDTVQLDDTKVMYRVVDDTKLNNADGYKIYTAGRASSVLWSGVEGKPTFANVATSGSYNDLTNKPTIPSKTSQLVNDSGFVNGSPLDEPCYEINSTSFMNIGEIPKFYNMVKQYNVVIIDADAIQMADPAARIVLPADLPNRCYTKTFIIKYAGTDSCERITWVKSTQGSETYDTPTIFWQDGAAPVLPWGADIGTELTTGSDLLVTLITVNGGGSWYGTYFNVKP